MHFQDRHDLSFNTCVAVRLLDGLVCFVLFHRISIERFVVLFFFLLRRSYEVCERARVRAHVQPQCAYFKGVDGFPLKAHGGSKRSIKLASEGELARGGLCHLIARWLEMSGCILGKQHLREISGKAVPFCCASEYPPGVSVLAMLLSALETEGGGGGIQG